MKKYCNIQALSDAAKCKAQVVLKNYESSHSGEVRDRRIEPFGFTTNYLDVWGYDLEDRKNKLFKIARIGDVEIQTEPWVAEKKHSAAAIDVFRMSGPNSYHVRLHLTYRAKNLMVEEYPLAEKCIRKNGDSYIFDADVRALEGVGRFVIGLAADVQIVEGEELKAYIHRYVADYLTNL